MDTVCMRSDMGRMANTNGRKCGCGCCSPTPTRSPVAILLQSG
eukprot:CAMPEP_0184353628 /NCGR_PEP_ID=MMETSP1089-20130417/80824_1 /TAXON_ID=38269 ORGANISM="Gloeochaete wittrockiana, Strain SAG46.84" /NCGR_SAMPLE_ID=MMETSP1089 /ASSEMBLY_ACC=CAM_ASM_000445 /LENGTH=42 /DNA_ID= /DNA_START= /DNA_END= /DNA_ORIENTATION=